MNTQNSTAILDVGMLFDVPLLRMTRRATKRRSPRRRTRDTDELLFTLGTERPREEDIERWDGLS